MAWLVFSTLTRRSRVESSSKLSLQLADPDFVKSRRLFDGLRIPEFEGPPRCQNNQWTTSLDN